MPRFIDKILWSTDFSDEAQEALLYAEAFAKTFDAKIIALHVVPDISPALYDAALVVKEELAKRVAYVKEEAEKKFDSLKKVKNLEFKTLVKEGNAAKKIIETAEEENVDLIVLGRRGLSAIEKLFIGSVANQVLRNSPVPLLLTKKKSGKPRFKKILVPTDFSEQEEIERFFLGSTTEKVISYTHVPIFAIPPSSCAR